METKEFTENEIKDIIEDVNSDEINFTFDEIKVIDNIPCIAVHGGLNGDGGENGKWVDYLEGMKDLFKKLGSKYKSVWLVKMDIDVSDDVFTFYVGFEE